jgi:hypothetical protein
MNALFYIYNLYFVFHFQTLICVLLLATSACMAAPSSFVQVVFFLNSFIHLFIHSLFIYLFIYLLFIYLFIIYSFIYLFIYLFILFTLFRYISFIICGPGWISW